MPRRKSLVSAISKMLMSGSFLLVSLLILRASAQPQSNAASSGKRSRAANALPRLNFDTTEPYSSIRVQSADLLSAIRTRVDQPYKITIIVGTPPPTPTSLTGNGPSPSPFAEIWFGIEPSNPVAGSPWYWIVPKSSPLGQKPLKLANGTTATYTVTSPDTPYFEHQYWFLTRDQTQQIYRDQKYSGPVGAFALVNVCPDTTFAFQWKSTGQPIDTSKPIELKGSPTQWDKIIVEMTNLYPSHRRLIVVTPPESIGKPYILGANDSNQTSSDVTYGGRLSDNSRIPINSNFEFDPARLFLNSGAYNIQVWTSVPILSIDSPGPPPADAVPNPGDPDSRWKWEKPPAGSIDFDVHRINGINGDIITN